MGHDISNIGYVPTTTLYCSGGVSECHATIVNCDPPEQE